MMTANQQRDLHGLRALVTGARSWLGRAIAFQLARDGADVIVRGRNATRGVQAVEEIQLQGGRAHFEVTYDFFSGRDFITAAVDEYKPNELDVTWSDNYFAPSAVRHVTTK
jgi:NAD(P)-dependent dehydrogenase (short-subunit alcohol dehydrogenase family)